MIETFNSKYNKLDNEYSNGKTINDHINIIRDCGIFIETSINYFNLNFHTSLKTEEDRKKFLNFEKGLKAPVIKHNTIGVFIGFLTELEKKFKSHKWIKEALPKKLNKANIIRNKYAHSNTGNNNQNKTTIELEADDMIYYAQDVMMSFGFEDKYIDVLGFDLSDFLVYTSIKDKFDNAKRDIHYQQVIHDTYKILPKVIRTFLYNIYPKVDFEEKEKIIEIINQNKNFVEAESEIKTLLVSVAKINLKSVIKEGGSEFINIINILQTRSSAKKKSLALRYISVIEYLLGFLKNEHLSAILEFANKVKKKYLENGNIIEDADKKYLSNIANDLHLPSVRAENIEKYVIETIEKKIIIFQTFSKEKNHAEKVNTEKKINNLFKYACLKLNDNLFEDAINDLTEIIELKYNVAFYYIYRGIAYEKIGRADKAEIDFSEALSINPKQEFHFYNKGLARYETNDFETALIEFNKALQFKNNDPDIYYYKGETLYKLNRFEDALAVYLKASEISPKHSGAKLGLKKIKKNKNFKEKARKKKRSISVHFNYACKKLNDKEYQKSIVDLDSIIDIDPNVAFYYIYRGIANELINNLAEAEKDFKHALQVNSREDFYYYNRGLARLEANDYRNAVKEFDKAITLKNDEADYYFFLGFTFEKLKDTKRAKKEYKKALEINPRHTEAPRNIEKIRFREKKKNKEKSTSLYINNLFRYVCSKLNDGDFREAIKDLDEIISIKPDVAFYFVYRGVANELLNKTEDAHKDFSKAMGINPAKDFFYFNKGVAFFETGCTERAIRELNSAIKVNDQIPDFYFHKALVYENAGDIENAILACNKTLELFPGHNEAKRKKNKLLEKQVKLEKIMEKKFSDFSNAHEFFENARYYLNEKDIENSIKELNKAIYILPDTAYYYVYRGIAFEKMENYSQAEKSYTTAKRINSNQAMFYFNKAKAEYDLGDYTKALTEINKAIEKKEKFAFVNYRMRINKKLNKIPDFEKDERKSLELQQNENL